MRKKGFPAFTGNFSSTVFLEIPSTTDERSPLPLLVGSMKPSGVFREPNALFGLVRMYEHAESTSLQLLCVLVLTSGHVYIRERGGPA